MSFLSPCLPVPPSPRHSFSVFILSLPRQLLVQILSADAEDACRLRLVAARGLKHLAYVLGLKLCERRSPCLTSARADRSPDRLRQIIRAHRLPLRDDDCALDDVRKLAHVAGEVVSVERGERLHVEAARRATVLRRVGFEELFGQGL